MTKHCVSSQSLHLFPRKERTRAGRHLGRKPACPSYRSLPSWQHGKQTEKIELLRRWRPEWASWQRLPFFKPAGGAIGFANAPGSTPLLTWSGGDGRVSEQPQHYMASASCIRARTCEKATWRQTPWILATRIQCVTRRDYGKSFRRNRRLHCALTIRVDVAPTYLCKYDKQQLSTFGGTTFR